MLILLATMAVDGGSNDAADANLLARITRRATGVVVDAVEPDAVLDKIDVNALLERIDVNELLDRVAVDDLLDRVDVDRLIARADVNALMERVDVDALMERVDIEALVDRAGISDIVRESTGALAGSALDVFRRQIVAVDTIVGRAFYRLRGRDPATRPEAPLGLDAASGVDDTGRGQVTGHYAGPITRLLAFVADIAVIWFGFLLMAFGVSFVIDLFTSGTNGGSAAGGYVAFVGLAVWSFMYFWVSFAIAGRTVGMAIMGARVVNRQGDLLTNRQALVRTLVLPVSVFFLGLGCLVILFSPERRGLHDAAAGSTVVYDWGDRPAELSAPITRWIAQREVPTDDAPPG